MSTLAIALVCITVAYCVTVIAFRDVVKYKSEDAALDLVDRTLLINTKKPDELAVKGVVSKMDNRVIVLREASHVVPGTRETPVAGLLTIPRDTVASWQEIAA